MTDVLNPMQTLVGILSEYGPLSQDDLVRRLRDSGMADPEPALDVILDEIYSPARQLVDSRWVWLPTLLDGRVFTHRLGADEVAHNMLSLSPDLNPITALCEHEEYQRLADGSAVQVVLPGTPTTTPTRWPRRWPTPW